MLFHKFWAIEKLCAILILLIPKGLCLMKHRSTPPTHSSSILADFGIIHLLLLGARSRSACNLPEKTRFDKF